MLNDICMKFRENSLNGFQDILRTRLSHSFVTDKVPRIITQKSINAIVTVLARCTSSNAG